MTFTALVLAGSRPGGDSFAEAFGTDLKALIPVGGEPMVVRPVRALLESEQVGDVIVLSQAPNRLADVLPDDARLKFRASGGTIASTLLELLDDKAIRWPLLVTTADHPLLDAETIDEFCRGASGAEIAIGVVERGLLLRRFPHAKRTWLKFRSGAFTGANLFALSSPKVRPAIEQWSAVEQDRKKAWRIMSLLGPVMMLVIAARLFSIDQVLDLLGDRLGLSLKAVKLGNPLAGIDVDKPEDHALAEAILAGKA